MHVVNSVTYKISFFKLTKFDHSTSIEELVDYFSAIIHYTKNKPVTGRRSLKCLKILSHRGNCQEIKFEVCVIIFILLNIFNRKML